MKVPSIKKNLEKNIHFKPSNSDEAYFYNTNVILIKQKYIVHYKSCLMIFFLIFCSQKSWISHHYQLFIFLVCYTHKSRTPFNLTLAYIKKWSLKSDNQSNEIGHQLSNLPHTHRRNRPIAVIYHHSEFHILAPTDHAKSTHPDQKPSQQISQPYTACRNSIGSYSSLTSPKHLSVMNH